MPQFTENLLERIRKQRLFSPPPVELEEEDDELSAPSYDTPALGKYRDYIGQVPQRENYKNPMLQRILAGVAGASTMDAPRAFATTRGILDSPYERAVDDYRLKGVGLRDAANMESEDNRNNYRRFIDTERLNTTRENNKSLAGYRNLQGEKIRNDIDYRSPEQQLFRSGLIEGRTNRADANRSNLRVNEAKTLLPLREASTNRSATHRGQISLSNAKELLPLQGANSIDVHEANRVFDVDNPLPSRTGAQGISPSQSRAATKMALEQVILRDPSYEKFTRRNTVGAITGIQKPIFNGSNAPSQKALDDHYNNLVKVLAKETEKITKQYRPNPLNDDTVANPQDDSDSDNERDDAIAALAEIGITDPDEAEIEQAIEEMRGQQ